MKKAKLLTMFAVLMAMGLSACTGGNTSQPASEPASEPVSQPSQQQSSQQQSSQQQSSQQQSSQQQSSAANSSSAQAAHKHEYELVGSAVKNADEKDVLLYECKEKDDRYIAIAFDDFSEQSAAFGSTASYNNVPEELRNESRLLAKESTITWKFNVDKAISGAKLEFGAVYTGSDHGSQTGTTDGGNAKYSFQVNSGEFVDWAVTSSDTYDGIGLSQTARAYVVFGSADLVAGENTITLRQNNAGYRLLFGGEVRVHYNSDAKPVVAPIPFEGYKVTFTTEHCKVLVYSTKSYETETPVETNSCVAKDETGQVVEYDIEDVALQPQVSFKVVCDNGYSCTVNNVTVTPKANYKNLKQNPDSKEGQDDIFRITKVQGELEIKIVATQGEQAKGYKVKFVTSHCSVKVYVGPKNEEGTNLDTPEDGYYYARAKDGTYEISYTTPQINFEVVCDSGYEFVPTITDDKVDFITHPTADKTGYNKFSLKSGCYNLTKIDDDLVITITATVAGEGQGGEGGEGGEGQGGETITPAKITIVTRNCTVKVYIGPKNEAGDNVDAGPDFFSRDKTDPTKYQIGDDAQFNFEVIPNAGYKFEDGGVTFDAKGEAVAANVPFISGTYNKLKKVDENLYKLTKIAGNLQITIGCVIDL